MAFATLIDSIPELVNFKLADAANLWRIGVSGGRRILLSRLQRTTTSATD